jgi:hypothetical protein
LFSPAGTDRFAGLVGHAARTDSADGRDINEDNAIVTLRWEKIRQDEAAELWKLDKPAPDGRGVVSFYRGRRFEHKAGVRTKLDEEAKFTDRAEALAWFERHRSA